MDGWLADGLTQIPTRNPNTHSGHTLGHAIHADCKHSLHALIWACTQWTHSGYALHSRRAATRQPSRIGERAQPAPHDVEKLSCRVPAGSDQHAPRACLKCMCHSVWVCVCVPQVCAPRVRLECVPREHPPSASPERARAPSVRLARVFGRSSGLK